MIMMMVINNDINQENRMMERNNDRAFHLMMSLVIFLLLSFVLCLPTHSIDQQKVQCVHFCEYLSVDSIDYSALT